MAHRGLLRILQGSLLLLFAFSLTAALTPAEAAAAEVSIVIGYETRNVGEIEPCG